MQKLKIGIRAALFLLVLAVVLSASVFAAPAVDPSKCASVSIACRFSDEKTDLMIPDAVFTLYRVASVDAGLHFTPVESLKSDCLNFSGTSPEGWNLLLGALEGIVSSSEMAPDAVLTTDGRTVYVQNTSTSDTPAEPLPDGIEYPDYVLNPDMQMPVETVDGLDYIGVIRIPAIDLELPVISEWSESNLKHAPCRYSGSAYRNDLVIAAHNYREYFGQIKSLRLGAQIDFTDIDGNEFSYCVSEIETLQPADVDALISGDWDLTIFTCTVGAQTRIAVRCDLCES